MTACMTEYKTAMHTDGTAVPPLPPGKLPLPLDSDFLHGNMRRSEGGREGVVGVGKEVGVNGMTQGLHSSPGLGDRDLCF